MQPKVNMSKEEVVALATADFKQKKFGRWRFASGLEETRTLFEVSESVLNSVDKEVIEAYEKLRTAKCTGSVCCNELDNDLALELSLTRLYNDTIITLMAEAMKK